MYFYKVDKNNYVVKIFNDNLQDIDIFNVNEVEKFIINIFRKFLKKYKLKGDVLLNIYIDLYYGIIIEINNDNDYCFDDEIDVKVVFHLNNTFLYEIDYFYILDEVNIKNANIYFYKNKFYLEVTDNIDIADKYKLLESSNVIWDNKCFEIVNKAIKLKLAS